MLFGPRAIAWRTDQYSNHMEMGVLTEVRLKPSLRIKTPRFLHLPFFFHFFFFLSTHFPKKTKSLLTYAEKLPDWNLSLCLAVSVAPSQNLKPR